ADVSLILRFESEFSDARVIKLEQNYRCSSSILECANHVVRHNRERRDKTLWTENAEGAPILLKRAADEREEARFVTEVIAKEASAAGRGWSDFGVLYRTNAQSRVLEEAFRARQIPYRMVGGQRFYERREIKDLVSYLRVIYNPDDRLSTVRAIATPSRGIGPANMERFNAFAEAERLSLYSAMLRADEVAGLTPKVRTAAQNFGRLIQELRRLQESIPVGELIERLLDRSGYAAELRSQHTPEAQERLQNINELLSTARQFEAHSEDSSLRAFLETLALASDLDTYQEGANAVTLMTLHSAKGLEFPVVFLVGLEDGLFPSQRSMDRQETLEEERRLCYVGLTRAREKLYLSHANSRMVAGVTGRCRPSRFLNEMKDHLTLQEPASRSAGPQPGLFPSGGPSGTERARLADLERSLYSIGPAAGKRRVAAVSAAPAAPASGSPGGGTAGGASTGTAGAAPPFRVGEKIRHATMGVGMVVQVNVDTQIISIAFEGQGVKKFQLGIAPIEKL
ncbi:MAG: exodeoxyribonuclease V subunit gamma, partial [Chloroflexi bacterium]|nr:exodeoxyribonuclease V subunit gamma [Chloroflexota bacterium]